MNSKKTILFILPNLKQGGAERIVTILINNLDRTIFTPKLLLLKKEGFYLNLIHSDIEIINLKINNIRNSLFPISFYIKKNKPNIVFSGFGEINAFVSPFIPLFPKTKFIARETNVVSQHVTRKEILFFYKFYNNFHTIIAQSNDMKEDLIENFNIKPNKIHLINNPVDFDLINKNLKNLTSPTEYQQTQAKKIIAIGNLSYRKGFDNLLQVFTHLKNENIELFILGEGPQKEEYLVFKRLNNLIKVHFLGMKNNPYIYLKYADLFILSSRYEGFPNVLLEAGACGTYALVNNCKGGINEIIQDKVNGEIANIENHKEFSNKIIEILSQTHNKDIIISSIKERYDKENILKEYFKILVSDKKNYKK